jgi:thiosulfate/3-mercaptopyruvate sulfurtransferase
MTVDAQWVAAHANDPQYVLVDARSPEEYAGTGHMAGERPGHIPGAINVDWLRFFADASQASVLPATNVVALLRSAGMKAGQRPVFYCTVGQRASYAYLVARASGLNPLIYTGSMADWISDPSRRVVKSASR